MNSTGKIIAAFITGVTAGAVLATIARSGREDTWQRYSRAQCQRMKEPADKISREPKTSGSAIPAGKTG